MPGDTKQERCSSHTQGRQLLLVLPLGFLTLEPEGAKEPVWPLATGRLSDVAGWLFTAAGGQGFA